jgi:Domain of unknown function (DUF6265)
MKIIFSLFTLVTICAFTIEKGIKEMQFLEGTWKMENKENYETWKMENESELKGSSYKIKSKEKITSEYLSIKEVNAKVVYTAKVLNQNKAQPIDFVLNPEVKNKFSFENLSHDFPKKIQYTKLDDSTLFVQVLGDNDKGFSYNMIKQK